MINLYINEPQLLKINIYFLFTNYKHSNLNPELKSSHLPCATHTIGEVTPPNHGSQVVLGAFDRTPCRQYTDSEGYVFFNTEKGKEITKLVILIKTLILNYVIVCIVISSVLLYEGIKIGWENDIRLVSFFFADLIYFLLKGIKN